MTKANRNLALITAELSKRAAAAAKFDIEKFLFSKQLKFVRDPNPFATAVCSVRAGKTIACAADLIDTALRIPGCNVAYITLNRASAKRIIWADLKRIVSEYQLDFVPNETELTLKSRAGSTIYVGGSPHKDQIEKWRGIALALAYVDECQAFSSYLEEFVEEVLAKRLFDYNGRLRLIGTPGPVPVGYFHKCAESKAWAQHHWTMFENPHLATKAGVSHEELLERELKRKGVSVDHPSIQRECFGRWTYDPSALVFRYDGERNHYDKSPRLSQFIVGVDLGLRDADAIAILGFDGHSKKTYLVEEIITTGQTIDSLAGQLYAVIKKYSPYKIVVDQGGLGAKIAETIRQRWHIPLVAAEKARKFEFIEILNDALRTGKFMAQKTSRFAEDCLKLEWDRDKTRPDRKVISDRYHSDICDAVLYAFRESAAWAESAKPVAPKYGSADWARQEEEQMEEEAERHFREQEEDFLKWAA